MDPVRKAELGRMMQNQLLFGIGPKIKDWKLHVGNPYLVGLEFVEVAD